MKEKGGTKKSVDKGKGTKKPWQKYLLATLVIVSLFFGYRFYKIKKVQAQRAELMERQQEIMIEAWEEKGLSEEEIQERIENMKEKREENLNDPDRVPREGFNMMRMGGQMRRMNE